jgi:hypothetical protein
MEKLSVKDSITLIPHHATRLVARQLMLKLMLLQNILSNGNNSPRNCSKKNKNKQKLTLYVVKIGNSRPLTNSAPCLKCTEILKASGQIKRIVFSNDEGEIISFRMRDYESSYVTLGDRYRDWVLI